MTRRAAPAEAAGPRDARRPLDIGALLAIESAATEVVEPVARMWRELAATADRTVTLPSLDAVLRDALSTIGRILSVNSVAILLADEAGEELVARAAIGLREEMSVGIGIRTGEGMAGQVLKTREPLVVGDLSAVHVVNPVLLGSGLRSVVAVPMLREGCPLGVMWAGSYERDRFTDADADLLQVVAERLAVELDRVRVLERERLARLDAERLAGRIARIQRATAELAATYSYGDVAGAIVRVLESEVPLWRAVWLSRDDHLDLLAQSGDPPPGWDAAAGPGGDAPLPAVLGSRTATFGIASDGGAGEGSWAVLPILTRHGPLGALAVVSGRMDWFTHDERSLLALVVGQAEQAFERAHLAAAERQAADRASFFARAAQVLAEADDLVETLDRLAELAVTAIGEICLIDVIAEDGHLARMAAKHRDPDLQPLVERLRTEFPPDPQGSHPAVRSISSGEATWSEVMSDELLRATTVNEEHLRVVRALGFRSYLTVPLVASGRVVGSVTCISTTRLFHHEDVSFAEELANHVASVVDNARRYETAYRTSHILQSSLLPARLPEVAGVSVETRYLTDAPPAAEWHGTLGEGQVLLGYTDGAVDERAAGSERSMATLARAASEGAVTPAAVCDRVVAAIASDRADDVALMAVAIRPR